MTARRHGDDERPLYMISVAAELAGTHPQTLRIYERKRLIRPQRSAGNTRLYSEADIQRLRLIQRLTQDEGVNLAGVERILEMQCELDRLRAEVERAVRRADEARREAARAAARARAEHRGEIVLVRRGGLSRRHPGGMA